MEEKALTERQDERGLGRSAECNDLSLSFILIKHDLENCMSSLNLSILTCNMGPIITYASLNCHIDVMK